MHNTITQEKIKFGQIDLATLCAFHRVLLTTDGTLTDMLASYLLEHIQLIKLSERIILLQNDIPALYVESGEEIIERKILLRGEISGKNYVFADSVVVIGRLDQKFQNELRTTQTPMGRLWLEHKMETFKEMIDIGKEPANELASYFCIEPEDILLSRTYRVFSRSRPVIMITEKFPVDNVL